MPQELIFSSVSTFNKTVDLLDKYAPYDFPVLLLGETGVGKELLARRLHARSSRNKAPFMAINCGAIPPGLFESELFGHERGAFSGAIMTSRGLVRAANQGTLFLDEVGELEPSAQAKLLRFLDSGEVRAVGSTRYEKADVRIVAATNVDLEQAVSQGGFRKDLLERLSVLRLQIPPLRERPEDIRVIAIHQIRALGCDLEEEALELLMRFSWKGNVRQLRNFIIRAVIENPRRLSQSLVKKMLEEEQLRDRTAVRVHQTEGTLAEIEKQVIVDRLRKHQGNRKRAAKDLGIAKSTLQEKLKRWKNDNRVTLLPPAATMAAPAHS